MNSNTSESSDFQPNLGNDIDTEIKRAKCALDNIVKSFAEKLGKALEEKLEEIMDDFENKNNF